MAEVRRFATLLPGQTFRIRRGDLAGWIVDIDGGQMCLGSTAAFSEGADLIEWLKCSIELSQQSPDGPGNPPPVTKG